MSDPWDSFVLATLCSSDLVSRRVLLGFDSNHRITFSAMIIRRCAFGPLNLSTVGRNRSNLIESRLKIDISKFDPRLHTSESEFR